MLPKPVRRPLSAMRAFPVNEARRGIALMAAAAAALVIANSPLAEDYRHALHAYLGPLSVLHWINDGLMAVFFLLVGLEIKREALEAWLSLSSFPISNPRSASALFIEFVVVRLRR